VKGRSSFQLLQVYKSSEQRVPLVYYVFDLLFLEGKDLRREPLSARRELFDGVLKKAPPNIRISAGLQGSTGDLVRVAEEFGLRAWSPNGFPQSTKAAGAAAPWSRLSSPGPRNSLSAGTRCPRETANTLALCWSATIVRRVFDSLAESEPVSQRNFWRASTRNCRNSKGRPARLSTYRRRPKADRALG
jgi:ATP dependent DNA ligase domain